MDFIPISWIVETGFKRLLSVFHGTKTEPMLAVFISQISLICFFIGGLNFIRYNLFFMSVLTILCLQFRKNDFPLFGCSVR